MRQNAYFQINTKNDGLYLKIFPPVDGGERVKLDDVLQRLKRLKISLYDEHVITSVLGRQTEVLELKFSDVITSPFEGDITVTVADDQMSAVARFYCESERSRDFTRESIIRLLIGAGVKHGISEEAMSEWLEERRYCEDVLIAEGTPVVESTDAYITNYFKSAFEFAPVFDDFGNIDFHQLNSINNVEQDDVLSILTPAYEGVAGMTVTGRPLHPRRPLRLTLKGGKNTHMSEDRLTLSAQCAGHVGMEGDKVVVYNVYTINGNCGAATGNIKYDGTVKVKGDVLTGYSISATGDIFVEGVVEGASLDAGGNIVVTRGIHGQRKGRVKAGGNVIAQFIQEVDVTVEGNVTSDSILHSFVKARGDIAVLTKKGLISGGEMRAGKLISAKIVGSSTGSNTQLEVGSSMEDIEEYNRLGKQIIEKRTELRKVRPSTGLHASKPKLEEEIALLVQQYARLKDKMDSNTAGKVVVMETIYEGTRIVISNVTYYVRKESTHCWFTKEDMDIKMYPC